MVDTSKVVDKLQQRSLAESPQLRRHRGVVQSVAGNGTIGITLDGGTTVLTGVRRVSDAYFNVGDTVEVLGDDTDLLVIGAVASRDLAVIPGNLEVGNTNAGTVIYVPSGGGSTFGSLLLLQPQIGTRGSGFRVQPQNNLAEWFCGTRYGSGEAQEFQIGYVADRSVTQPERAENGLFWVHGPSQEVWFLDRGQFYMKRVTDGYRLGSFSDLTYIDFLRAGSKDTLKLSTNDEMIFEMTGGGTVLVNPTTTYGGFHRSAWTGIRLVGVSPGGLQVMNPAFNAWRQVEASAFNVNSDERNKRDVIVVNDDFIGQAKSARQRGAVARFKRKDAEREEAGIPLQEELGFVANRLPEELQVDMVEGEGEDTIITKGYSLSAVCAWQQHIIEQLIDRTENLEQRLAALEG